VASTLFDSIIKNIQFEHSNLFLLGNEMIFENNKMSKLGLNVLPHLKNIVLK